MCQEPRTPGSKSSNVGQHGVALPQIRVDHGAAGPPSPSCTPPPHVHTSPLLPKPPEDPGPRAMLLSTVSGRGNQTRGLIGRTGCGAAGPSSHAVMPLAGGLYLEPLLRSSRTYVPRRCLQMSQRNVPVWWVCPRRRGRSTHFWVWPWVGVLSVGGREGPGLVNHVSLEKWGRMACPRGTLERACPIPAVSYGPRQSSRK